MTPINSGHLIWWLRKQLDEDEAGVQRFTVEIPEGYTMEQSFSETGVRLIPTYPYGETIYLTDEQAREQLYRPAEPDRRILADVAAKRRIVDRCEVALSSPMGDELYALERYFALYVLRELATAYAERDGFDEGWRTT